MFYSLKSIPFVSINITLKNYWTDAKAIAVSPVKWDSKDWTKLGVFVVAECGLSFADQPVKDFFQSHKTNTGTFLSTHIFQGFGAEHSLIVISGIFTYGRIGKKQQKREYWFNGFGEFCFSKFGYKEFLKLWLDVNALIIGKAMDLMP